MTTTPPDDGFDSAAAVTRSLLGWGVVVGPFHLLVGVVLGVTTDGFDVARHPLSLLMLGDLGWIQTTNLALSGFMVGAAALGVVRAWAADGPSARWVAVLLALAALGLIGSAVFPPDPASGFPPGTASTATASGIGHLVFGAVTFPALAAAAVVAGRRYARHAMPVMARYSVATGAVVVLGSVGGAAFASSATGVAALWVAVVTGFAWLLLASLAAYREVPHPDIARRALGPIPGTRSR